MTLKKQSNSKPLLDYTKYRWFFTASGKLVVGGKSAIQNDELLKKLKATKKDYLAMHTSTPGSPFAIILASKEKLKKSDIEEAAIFTGCFSREWRSRKQKASIHIFTLNQLSKPLKAKTGLWKVKGKIENRSVDLELGLLKQEGVLRAVPLITAKNSKIFIKIRPGKLDKTEMVSKLQVETKEQLNQEELLSALPAGGVAISRK